MKNISELYCLKNIYAFYSSVRVSYSPLPFPRESPTRARQACRPSTGQSRWHFSSHSYGPQIYSALLQQAGCTVYYIYFFHHRFCLNIKSRIRLFWKVYLQNTYLNYGVVGIHAKAVECVDLGVVKCRNIYLFTLKYVWWMPIGYWCFKTACSWDQPVVQYLVTEYKKGNCVLTNTWKY